MVFQPGHAYVAGIGNGGQLVNEEGLKTAEARPSPHALRYTRAPSAAVFVSAAIGQGIANAVLGTGGNDIDTADKERCAHIALKTNCVHPMLEVCAFGLVKLSLSLYYCHIFGVQPWFRRVNNATIMLVAYILVRSLGQIPLQNGESTTSPGDALFILHHVYVAKMSWDWQAQGLDQRVCDIGGLNDPVPAIGFAELSGGQEVESRSDNGSET
ncbi:hypothetical protein F4780DRAFT_778664 [Xylariomycetidae sp. FL0641]|nr:hypothetical protein F4780DRAFT_778664 [Xylariomycetidae sp. FL0641]